MSNSQYCNYLRKKGIRIGSNVHFRYPAHTTIDITRPCLIKLGNIIDINDYFTILTHDFSSFVFRGYYKDFVNSSGKVSIGDNVVFGRNVTVLKGVHIGNNCIIGAGSIVSKSIPNNSVAVGVPARVICSLEDYYKRRKTLSINEAFEYAKEVASIKGGIDNLKITDFPEEWVLFLSYDEYIKQPSTQKIVNFRLLNYINISDFLNRPRPFNNFHDFIEAIRSNNAIEQR